MPEGWSDIRIVQQLGRNIPPVLADPEAMKRAMANLIDNAAEAMQTSLLRQLTIETSIIEGQTMAEIVVADTGHGLNDEMRERLFLPYFSTKQRGTGLGLAIAAKIVQEHRWSHSRGTEQSSRRALHHRTAAGGAEERRIAGRGIGLRLARHRRNH